jgi:hypothetical protein
MTRSPTPLSNKVASLFGSRAPLCDEHAGRRRAVRSKGLTTASSSAIAQAIDFPDISRAMSKLIVTFAIPDDQQTPRPVRAALPERARS